MVGANSPEESLRAAGASIEEAPEASPEYSDDAIALAFSAHHAEHLLYVPEWGRWLQWDGVRWVADTVLAVHDLVRRACRKAAARALEAANPRERWSIAGLASAQKVAAVERLVRSDRRHAQASDQFDADPWLLNTPGGVVDLQDGRTRPHRPADLFTKVTATAPVQGCPLWLAFINEITQGDAGAATYLQCWCGYALTGLVREHAFLFLYGPGGNGKSVLLNTLAAVMGDYATVADMDLFTATHGHQHPTGLADLRGARLVVAQETEADKPLAEARVKALTGGDRIKARFMGRDFFAFQPAFKLIMAGNHRPVLRNPDDAMRRRLHLLPLTHRPAQPNPDLPDLLRNEMPGILAWAIEGCLLWQMHGLGMPLVAKEATADYFAEQDLLARWLAERCEDRPSATTLSSVLYRDWSQWATERGEQAGTQKAFSGTLERYRAKKRTNEGVVFIGIKLKPSLGGVL
ncbi:hypothetical protein JMJ55_26180 [Belnapia sp. T6]|uniref:SF3 helicase domain-containing protein n=1 Tax=Belnapia mucosa TaxID=2804532 RepID=A0ABS1VDK9_9PROT|nr:phage/plasmid primase, P4 family [Belnapia mucosa]MBL6458824.1 hypothetical protein [Belnapia mucosa]